MGENRDNSYWTTGLRRLQEADNRFSRNIFSVSEIFPSLERGHNQQVDDKQETGLRSLSLWERAGAYRFTGVGAGLQV